jgi:CheY-like chemotaxis protein
MPHTKRSSTPADAMNFRPLLVLHVEDNRDDQTLFQAASAHAGIPIKWEVAHSVEAAIAHLESCCASLGKHRLPDLILLDLHLRGGAHGLDLLRYVRAVPALSHLPIVVLTGSPAKSLHEANQLGAKLVLEKPCNLDQLILTLATLYRDWSNHPEHTLSSNIIPFSALKPTLRSHSLSE